MSKIVEFASYVIRKGGLPPLGVFILHIIAGKGFDAYRLYPAFDIPMHFFGGAAICYLFWICSKAPHAELFLGKHSKVSLFILLVALTGTTTVFWEFSEWLSDTFFMEHAQVSITDTMGDMLLGLIGGVTVSLCVNIK